MFKIALQQCCKKVCNTAGQHSPMQMVLGLKIPNNSQIWHQHSPILMLLVVSVLSAQRQQNAFVLTLDPFGVVLSQENFSMKYASHIKSDQTLICLFGFFFFFFFFIYFEPSPFLATRYSLTKKKLKHHGYVE